MTHELDDQNADFHRLRRDLEDACLAGDVSRVRQLFVDAELDATDATDTLRSSEGFPLSIIRFLLEFGADVDKFVPWAASNGELRSLEAMELLVEFGYDVKSKGHLILHDFVSSPEILDWMLDRGADITRSDETRRTARGRYRMMGGGKDYSLEVLNRAAGQGNVEMFEHLVYRGADPSRSLALHRASECDDPTKLVAMIDHLLDKHHFDVEADNRKFLETGPRRDVVTPLHVAIYNKNIGAVRHLLKRGADPASGIRIAIGSAVIVREGWLPAVEALLDAGADVNYIFDHAVDVAKVEVAKACLDRGTVSASALQQAQPRPISSGSNSVFAEERAKMEALLLSVGGST